MKTWDTRSKVVVGVIVLAVVAFVASASLDGNPVSNFLIFLAYSLVIVGLAVGTVLLFRRTGRRDPRADTRSGLSRTQIAMAIALVAFAVYAAVDASRANSGNLVAFVIEMVLGLVIVNAVVLAVGFVRRHRGPAAPAVE